MKTLKITLILALFFISLTSCTKQDLNDDDVQVAPDSQVVSSTGGGIDD
jgi:predicted small lipoprotein YifL